MYIFNFQAQQKEGTLSGFRALLGPWRPVRGQFAPVLCMRAFFAVLFTATILADVGMCVRRAPARLTPSSYNDNMPKNPRPLDGDHVEWGVRGTNLASVVALLYCIAACWYYFAPSFKGNDRSIQPINWLGRTVWMLHVIGTAGTFTSVWVYCLLLEGRTTYRVSEPVNLGAVCGAMLLNLILCNTPLTVDHGFFFMLVVFLYFAAVVTYEYFTGLNVYPGVTTIFQVIMLTIFSGGCYFVLWTVVQLRERFLGDSLVWNDPRAPPPNEPFMQLAGIVPEPERAAVAGGASA